MTGVGDAIIRPMKNSLDELPVHVRQLAEMFRGHGQRQARNRNGTNDVDRFDDGVVTTRGGNSKATHFADNGRPISERGTITEDFGGGDRGDNATDVGNLGQSTDDGGHLGAHRFYGDTPDEGIAPQASNLNRGPWKTMENEWADWVNKGYEVNYDIGVHPPGAVRPDKFEVEYTVTNPNTGEVVRDHAHVFRNDHEQSFPRIPNRNIPHAPTE
ncbi:DNA/RNA non-specific endonuclease [Microbacterium sp. M]|uniref:DNA/RNA non-specific endonuclease n=1 Tax=Microbacterium sp. M TaxID=3377125 RepID=UPI003869DD61